jgi:hypothetical protein
MVRQVELSSEVNPLMSGEVNFARVASFAGAKAIVCKRATRLANGG